MSNINNQTQDLFALDTVQDLDNESAAAVSGGEVPPDVTLNSGTGQQGRKLETNNAIRDLRRYNFNNITSSVAINNNKVWRFYNLPNFRGEYEDVAPNSARNLGTLNNRVSSLKSIG